MKIIKLGKTNLETKRFACEKCGCVFEADKVEYRPADQMEYMHDGIESVCSCPYCNSTVYKRR